MSSCVRAQEQGRSETPGDPSTNGHAADGGLDRIVSEAFKAALREDLVRVRARCELLMPLPVLTSRGPGGRRYRVSTTGRCVNCGCSHDEKTRGCQACINRHNKRKEALRGADPIGNARMRRLCVQCFREGRETSLDSNHKGCAACFRRHHMRRQDALKRAREAVYG